METVTQHEQQNQPMDTSAGAVASLADSSSSASDKSERKAKRKREMDIDIAAATDAPENAPTNAEGNDSSAAAVVVAASPVATSAPLLLGRDGSDAIRHGLARPDPKVFIDKFQKEHSIRVSGIESSLSFIDLFAPSRAPVYNSIFTELSRLLLNRIENGQVNSDRMMQLLEQSFPYIKLEQMSHVPVTVMTALARSNNLPHKYLKSLSHNATGDFLDTLPLDLRRKLMEYDSDKHFWHHQQMKTWLLAYADDTTRIQQYMQLLPLDHIVSALRQTRKGNTKKDSSSSTNSTTVTAPDAINGILEWVGPSQKLYKSLCKRLRELVVSTETSTASSSASWVWKNLRVDLIMRIHEKQSETKTNNSSDPNYMANNSSNLHLSVGSSSGSASSSAIAAAPSFPDIPAAQLDPYHAWVWCLDAAMKSATHSLSEAFVDKALRFQSELWSKHPSTTLTDLCILTGHAFNASTILQSLMQCLGQIVEQEIEPKDHTLLVSLTSILQLSQLSTEQIASKYPNSVSVQQVVQLPEVANFDEVFTEFYPLMVELFIYAQLGEMEPLNPKLIKLAGSSALNRSVFLFYLLTRIEANDVMQVPLLLEALPMMVEEEKNVWNEAKAHGEQQPLHAFLYTLVSLFITHKQLLKDSPKIRHAVFQGCLLPLSRLSSFAHRECLRLLTSVDEFLPLEDRARAIQYIEEHGDTGLDQPVKQESEEDAMETDSSKPEASGAASAVQPTNTIPQEISRMYEQLRESAPFLFKSK